MDWLGTLVDSVVRQIQPWAEQYGAAGLGLIALIDSSFVSLPQVADGLLIGLTISHPSRAALYAAATATGSVVGCYVLFAVGRRGGEAFLRGKFHERHIDRGLALIERHGWLAVTVPSLMPPPIPLKLFILLAGIANLRPATFVMAIAVGRALRYGTEAWLAYVYGEAAAAFVRDRLPLFSGLLAGLIVAAGIGLFVWRRRRGRPVAAPDQPRPSA